MLPPAHPQLLSDDLPVSLFVFPADLLQLLHLLLAPPSLINGRVEEVLPETADVPCIPRLFKLGTMVKEVITSTLRHFCIRHRIH